MTDDTRIPDERHKPDEASAEERIPTLGELLRGTPEDKSTSSQSASNIPTPQEQAEKIDPAKDDETILYGADEGGFADEYFDNEDAHEYYDDPDEAGYHPDA